MLQSPQHNSDSSSAGSEDISVPANNRVSAASNNTTVNNGDPSEPATRNLPSYSQGSQHSHQHHHYHPNHHQHQHHQQHMQMMQPGLSPQGSMQFYMMYPQPHYYGAGDAHSPMGPPSPLMGSPVGTPTAMMFPQTPFAQHTNFQGYGGGGEVVPMSPAHMYSAQQGYGYFHPLFNNFPAYVPQPYGSSPPGGNNGNGGGKKSLQRSGGSLKMGGASGSSPNLNYPFHQPSHYLLGSQKSNGSISHFFGPGMQDGYRNLNGNGRTARTASNSISRALSATKSEAESLAAHVAVQALTECVYPPRDGPSPTEARQSRRSEASPPPLQQPQNARLSLPGMPNPAVMNASGGMAAFDAPPALLLLGGVAAKLQAGDGVNMHHAITHGQISASLAPPTSIAAAASAAATAALTASPGAIPPPSPPAELYQPPLAQQESVAWPPSPLELSHGIPPQHSDLLGQSMYQQHQAAMLQQLQQGMMMPYMYDQQQMIQGAGGELVSQLPYPALWQTQEQQLAPPHPPPGHQPYGGTLSARSSQPGARLSTGDGKSDLKRLPGNRMYASPQPPPVPSYQQQQRAMQEQYQAQQLAHQQAQLQQAQAQQHAVNSILAQLGAMPGGQSMQAQLFHLQQQQQQFNMLSGGGYGGMDQNMGWAVSLPNGGQISSQANLPFAGGAQMQGPSYPPPNPPPRGSGGASLPPYNDLGFPSHLSPIRYGRNGGAGSPQSPNSPAQRGGGGNNGYSPVRGGGGSGSMLSPAMRRGLLAPRSPAPGSPDSGGLTPSAPRLNARQRRTQRRAQEREVKGDGAVSGECPLSTCFGSTHLFLGSTHVSLLRFKVLDMMVLHLSKRAQQSTFCGGYLACFCDSSELHPDRFANAARETVLIFHQFVNPTVLNPLTMWLLPLSKTSCARLIQLPDESERCSACTASTL